MFRLRLVAIGFVVLAGGCGTQAEPDATDSGRPPAPLTAADMDRFLAVVQSNDDALIPEFEPPQDASDLDYRLSAAGLVAECRRQFSKVFDTERQGRVWALDERWARAFRAQSISGAEFASVVRRVSCAVMRVRLDARVKIERVVRQARSEMDEIVATIEAIDELPADERTRQDQLIRAQMALRLARLVALLEFSEMVAATPAEDCALVRKYSARLKPLLAQAGTDNLLAELQALVAPASDDVVPAGHTKPE